MIREWLNDDWITYAVKEVKEVVEDEIVDYEEVVNEVVVDKNDDEDDIEIIKNCVNSFFSEAKFEG